MKKLKTIISLDGLDLGTESKLSPQALFQRVVINTLITYSNQTRGLNKTERSQYYKIQDALIQATDKSLEEIELEDDLVGFLRKCFREARLTPNDIVKRIEENIDAIEMR